MRHLYDVFNKTTGKAVFQNNNTSCFAEYMDGYATIFNAKNIMKVYHPLSQCMVTEDILKKWCKYLTMIGMPIKLTVEENIQRPVPKNSYIYNPTGKGYTFEFDMAKYLNATHLKFALHIFRHCYENGMERPLLKAFELKKKYPKHSLLQLLQFAYMTDRPTNGHNLYSYYSLVDIKSPAQVRKYLKGDIKWGNMSVNNFFKGIDPPRAQYDYRWYEKHSVIELIMPEEKDRDNVLVYKKKLKEWRRKKPQPMLDLNLGK